MSDFAMEVVFVTTAKSTQLAVNRSHFYTIALLTLVLPFYMEKQPIKLQEFAMIYTPIRKAFLLSSYKRIGKLNQILGFSINFRGMQVEDSKYSWLIERTNSIS